MCRYDNMRHLTEKQNRGDGDRGGGGGGGGVWCGGVVVVWW